MLNKEKGFTRAVYEFPKELDRETASAKLETMGISIDKWTPEQEAYARRTLYDRVGVMTHSHLFLLISLQVIRFHLLSYLSSYLLSLVFLYDGLFNLEVSAVFDNHLVEQEDLIEQHRPMMKLKPAIGTHNSERDSRILRYEPSFNSFK